MTYFAATRHPWACLVFLVPLLAAYELGVLWIGGPVRNGADVWLRWGLERYGVNQFLAAPLLVVGLFLLRSLLAWNGRPKHILAIVLGMFVECVAFAILLWLISSNFRPLLDQMGVALQLPPPTPQAASIITFVGAGIYEEVVFRLVLFSVTVFVLRLVLPTPAAVLLGAVLAAAAFAAAHHAGPYGEWPVVPEVFAFRLVAGLFFTALYVFRGFGIAVGAHAGYDVLVGVVLAPPPAA